MPLIIRPGAPLSFPHAARTEHLAFSTNPFTPIFFPGPFPPGAVEDFRSQQIAQNLEKDATTNWLKFVEADAEGPDIGVSYAKRHVYDTRLPGPRETGEFGEGYNVEACNMVFGALGKIRERLVAEKYCVYPAYQGNGAGSLLIKWGNDKADELGLPAYVESSEMRHSLHKKHAR